MRAPTSTGSSGSRPTRPWPSRGSVMERFHPDSARRSCATPSSTGAGATGNDVEMLLRFRRDPASEDWREAEAVYTLEWGPDGELQGLVGYLVDVSERHVAQRAADERRFLLESIFHASPDTIVVRDISGQVVLGSSPLADVIGTTDRLAPDDLAPGALARDDHLVVLDALIARCVAGEQSPDPVVTTGRLPGWGSPHLRDPGPTGVRPQRARHGHGHDLARRHRADAPRAVVAPRVGGCRAGQPGQERVPVAHEPRAAHAAQCHPRLRAAARAGRAPRRPGRRASIRSRWPGAICCRSSTRCSTSRASKPGG